MAFLQDLIQGSSQTVVVKKRLGLVTLGANTGFVEFAGIDQSYDRLILSVLAQSDRASDTGNIDIAFNGDSTGSNYLRQQIVGQNNVSSASENSDRAAFHCPGSSGSANAFSQSEGVIEGYSDTTKTKSIRSGIANPYSTGSASFVGSRIVSWNNTAAITTIRLEPNSATVFIAGSRFELWAEKELVVGGNGIQGSVEHIETVTTSGSQTQVTFSGLSGSDLYLLVGTYEPSANSDLHMWVNGDNTNTNYHNQQTTFGGGASASQSNANIVAFSNLGNTWGSHFTVTISRDAINNVIAWKGESVYGAAGSANINTRMIGCAHTAGGDADITQLQLENATGNFLDGGVFKLYKINNA